MPSRLGRWVSAATMLFSGHFALSALAVGREGGATRWETEVGGWSISFEDESTRLDCEHKQSGIKVAGNLAFSASADGNPSAWRVGLPRDSIRERLALFDARGEIQGYVTFSGAGDRLQIGVIHRAAQNFRGDLSYQATVTMPGPAFACRTRPPDRGRVVQLASGPADSLLNDSLFDPESDTLLQFEGSTMLIAAGGSPQPGSFSVGLSATPDRAATSQIDLQVVPHYYRSRYAPYYRPLDRRRLPRAPTGWLSWNTYFDVAGEKENLAEARLAAELLKPFGLEFWSIESWQENSPELPVSRFHNLTMLPDPSKFPHGMKWLAEQIRSLGFRPGIWTVPFGTGSPDFYRTHRGWFLHDAAGNPMHNWCGQYVLDPSQEEVRRFMEETHRVMSSEWGYEYFKIDGMSGRSSSYSAHFYERDDVRSAFKEPVDDPLKLCVEALRRGIGPDRIWLACQGHYTGPELAFADAGRLGADIVEPLKAPEWHNYLNQARTTLNQLFVNNIAWYGDPDTLLVGNAAPLSTARLAATVVALSGQSMFAGDKLGELPAERLRLLQQCLPVCDIRPLDLYPIFELLPVWDLKIRRDFGSWDVVALFNWEETKANVGFDFAEIGLDPQVEYLVYDLWGRRLHRGVKGHFSLQIADHANALLTVQSSFDRPQVVSSDRHLTQGGIEIERVDWDDSRNTLSGIVRLVANHPTELVVAVPEGFQLQGTEATAGTEIRASARGDTVSVVLRRPDSVSTSWQLHFTPQASRP